jgi:ATP-dependent Clp protease ATP-binding subunit ClpA
MCPDDAACQRKRQEQQSNCDMERTFRPRFRTRVDPSIAFQFARDGDYRKGGPEVHRRTATATRGETCALDLTEPAGAWLAKKGLDYHFGTRPMARSIHRRIKELGA